MAKEAFDIEYKNNELEMNDMREEMYLYNIKREKEELITIVSWKVRANSYRYKARLNELFKLADDAYQAQWKSTNQSPLVAIAKEKKYQQHKKLLMDEIGVIDRNEYERILIEHGSNEFDWEFIYKHDILGVD